MQRYTFSIRFYYILLFYVIFVFSSCKQANPGLHQYEITKSVISDSAAVVCAHPLATKVGVDILKSGGNAVDAVIAVQLALAVCYPNAGNIGGGGFMVFRGNNGEISALDYREKAASAATTNMYLDTLGNPIVEKSLFGHLAAGVPGSVDGMVKAFEKYSKLKDWKKLVQPAIDIAQNGFKITQREADNLNEDHEKFKKYNLASTAFQKSKWEAGDLLIQPELATTLTAIRDLGRAGFYEGKVADYIVQEMNDGGGIISHKDLKDYNAAWREPVVTAYRGHKVISMPPPSSGGLLLVQLLKMVEPYDLGAMKFHSPAAVHLIAEAERRAYADRAKYMGDPDFYKVPADKLSDSQYILSRMKDFDPRKASKSDNITPGMIESSETTHISIVDAEGNAVAVTTTLNGGYGSYTVVRGAGFLLNNEMDDFSVKPGAPNMYGLVGGEANKIEPGKRMLSSMTPTIIEKDGKLKMVVGTPGGSTIITSVFQTITNVIDFGMDADKAVQSPRFHHQWLPDQIFVEKDAISVSDRKALEAIGHTLKERGAIGRVEAIVKRDDGKLHSAADRRGDDDAKGY
ncbi:MAG: gamma-glutamyltransferase [Saprospiraceae bacterium]|nr:gamma-glutamyltransferase [Saprospiraceae bacterium]MBP6446946.1 gamma-glutamyltransferase [Saprospiraceae bacterium]